MIKSRGYRIEIGEIETTLLSIEEVKKVVVVPIADELIGNRIAALIVPTRNGCVKKEEIIRYCSKKLPKYMMPEIIEIRESLPMTSSGKIDRKYLTQQMSHLSKGSLDGK